MINPPDITLITGQFSFFRVFEDKGATPRDLTNHPGRCAATPPLKGGEWGRLGTNPFPSFQRRGGRAAAGVVSKVAKPPLMLPRKGAPFFHFKYLLIVSSTPSKFSFNS